MKVKVNVTQKHIDSGSTGSTLNCPISKALKDAGFKSTYVDHEVLVVSNHLHNCITFDFMQKRPSGVSGIVTPLKVLKFIEMFDSHKDVKPFTFYINIHKDTVPVGQPTVN